MVQDDRVSPSSWGTESECSMTRVLQFKRPVQISKDELDRQRVCQAIVTIHAMKSYYEGMDMLCKVVGWPPLLHGFHTPEEMNAWLESVIKPPLPRDAEVIVAKKYKTKKCGTCGRRHDPDRKYLRKSKTVCQGCGRRTNKREGTT